MDIAGIRQELQEENALMATSWAEMSIRSRVRDLSEVTERYKLKQKWQRSLSFTRLANELRGRCAKSR